MSFGITGTCYAIATQLEAKKCGLLYGYDSESKLLSYTKVNSAYTTNTSLNKINGPILYTSVTLNGKSGWHQNTSSYTYYLYAVIPDSLRGTPGMKIESTTTINFSTVTKSSTIEYSFGFSKTITSINQIVTTGAVGISSEDPSIDINIDSNVSICPELLGYKYFVIRFVYRDEPQYIGTPITYPSIKCTPNGKLMTGKTFQSYNITRNWAWRIAENVSGKTNVNYIKYYYYHGGATNTAVGSMTQKLVIERGSSFFGDKVDVSKQITVAIPVNRFQILGITGTLASLPKSDRMVFHCGESSIKQTWTGSVIETSYTGIPLSTSFVNYASLGNGKTMVYGNNSTDYPFYSRTFEECLDSLAGVGFYVT